MKKIIIALTIWLCLCAPAFASIDAETVYNTHPSEFSFITEESVNDTLQQIDNLIKTNSEMTYIWYNWRSVEYGARWDLQISWRPSVKILTGQQLTDSEMRTKEKAEETLQSVVADDMSDYQKVFEIYHWIQNRTEYDHAAAERERFRHENNPCDNATGVFFDGKAVCDGYADAFYLLSNMTGIDSYFVHGGNHCWNIVKLRDTWYYIDVTDESGYCFLRGTDWLEKHGYVVKSYVPIEVSKTDYAF